MLFVHCLIALSFYFRKNLLKIFFLFLSVLNLAVTASHFLSFDWLCCCFWTVLVGIEFIKSWANYYVNSTFVKSVYCIDYTLFKYFMAWFKKPICLVHFLLVCNNCTILFLWILQGSKVTAIYFQFGGFTIVVL